MAVYRIFPDSDAFIYTEEITGNAGRDEINEIGGYPVEGVGNTSRILIKFTTSEIQDVIDNKIGANTFTSSLHAYLATATELPQSFSVYSYPVYDTWLPGIGKYGDKPVDNSGVSWTYPEGYVDTLSTRWTTGSALPAGVTGSYPPSGQLGNEGGGSWYTGSGGVNLESEQVFNVSDDLDLNIDITNAVTLHYSESIDNNGYIFKINDELEFNVTSSIRLKYYSNDTNTIYPTFLEFAWDDSVYNAGSLSLLNSEESFIDITNNRGRYVDEGKQRFRIKARPKYPTRTFTTSSAYTTNYALPSGSYWGLKDEYTEEMIIPFNNGSTKISCDTTGPYFDIYMDSLQPERFYRVLIKTTLDGSTTVIDNGITFKVVRNG